MIEQVDIPIPGVTVYSVELPKSSGFPIEDFLSLYEVEANRIWSHLPFFNGTVGDVNHADSFWSPMIGILNAKQKRLLRILSKYEILNEAMEQCLDDYRIFYQCSWDHDSGLKLIKVKGNQFSAHLEPPSAEWSSVVFMALTDLTVLLTKFNKEISVKKGQIVAIPAQFPYTFQVQPSQLGVAYLLNKYLFPA